MDGALVKTKVAAECLEAVIRVVREAANQVSEEEDLVVEAVPGEEGDDDDE